MEYLVYIVGSILGLLVILVLLSVLDTALHRLSRVELLVLTEHNAHREDPMLRLLARDSAAVQLHLRVGAQLTVVVIAILTTYAFLTGGSPYSLLWSFMSVGAVVLVFRQILPSMIAHRQPERRLMQLMPVLKLFHIAARPLALPVLSSWRLLERNNGGEPQEAAEASEQEIQAYLDVGEEEGLIEEDDSELIQSVVEFGDTLVKEVMTPRTEIVAMEQSASVRELRDLMLKKKHSRIPVYREHIDNIVGMVYVRHILGYCEEGRYNTPVAKFVLPVPFVPETKRVGELLKELQSSGAHLAAVVDEFGGVAGLVTIEDLLEVIVGEIRDEDEPLEEAIRHEADGTLRLSGDAPLERLRDLTELPEPNGDCTTVSGLVIQQLGRVPATGERVHLKGYQVEVLNSDGRRIVDLRLIPTHEKTAESA